MKYSERIWKFSTSKYGKWVFYFLWALFVTNLWLPRNWSFYGGEDWDLTYTMFESARKAVVEYGSVPLYNPFVSFGYDFVADPQAGQFSIFFIPILVFGTFYGYKLSILLAMVLGAIGSFKLFKSIQKDEKISLFLSLILCAANYFSAHIFRAGHSNVLYLYLVPWLFYFLVKLKEKYTLKYTIGAVLVLLQMIIGGAPIVFLIAVALMLLWLIADWWIYGNRQGILLFPAILIISICFGFWKILPGLKLWEETPRLMKDESGISLFQWLQSLGGYESRMGTWHGWWEYTLGFNIILLGIIFYYKNEIKSWWKWLVLAIPVIWICLGNTPEMVNPWYWMNKYLPVFSSLRAPSRFGFIVLFAIAVAVVFVLKNTKEKGFAYAILLFAAIAQSLSFRADCSFVQDSPMMEVKNVVSQHPDPKLVTVRIPDAEKKRGFIHLLQNELVLNAYQPLNLPPVFDTMRSFVSGAEKIHFTPGKMNISTSGDLLVFNLRYSKYWQLHGEGKIKFYSGLLSVEKPGKEIVLKYKNPYVMQGFLFGIIGIIILIIIHFIQIKMNKSLLQN
ncbi:MAG: hypothetical protein KG003_10965 [Bacteroidetes bacterium]|nr:hypothetical protein [Bacteroidota bacterium]